MSHARARLSRARRQRLRRRRLRAETVPTPQTLARLRPDPLWLLLQRGRLSQEQVDAAHDIRDAFELIAAPVRLRTMRAVSTVDGTSFDMTRGGNGRGGNGESDRAILLQQRFGQWVEAMKAARLPVGPLIDIAVEGKGCRTIDRERGRRNGWAVDVLVRGLDLYLVTKRSPRRATVHARGHQARSCCPESGTDSGQETARSWRWPAPER
jgi:hypothetical protein